MGLDRAQSLLAAIVASSDDAIISKDLNGIVTSWNHAAERIFGYTAQEMIGHPIAVLAPPDRQEEMPMLLARIRSGQRVEHFDTTRRCKDGRILNISLTISPIRDGEGNVVGASKIARDITERKEMERMLATHAERLTNANAELQQFAYIVSHDLREPARTVRTFAELLASRYRNVLDQEAGELLDFLMKSSTHLVNLLDDLLKYTHAVHSTKEFADVSLDDVLEIAIENLAGAIQQSRASIESAALPQVHGSKMLLVQVLQNLLSNAIKYARPGEAPKIRVDATRSGSHWRIMVQDCGIGMPHQYLSQIFQLFKRLNGSPAEGTGMGLALCKTIVEKHGGRIWAESGPGAGSTFFFTLPKAKAQEQAARDAANEETR